MLLPTTSILVWCARRPEMAENIERSMGEELLAGGVRLRRAGEGSGDLGDAAQRHGSPADGGGRLAAVVAEDDRGDGAGLGRAGAVGVGHGVTDDHAGVHG